MTACVPGPDLEFEFESYFSEVPCQAGPWEASLRWPVVHAREGIRQENVPRRGVVGRVHALVGARAVSGCRRAGRRRAWGGAD